MESAITDLAISGASSLLNTGSHVVTVLVLLNGGLVYVAYRLYRRWEKMLSGRIASLEEALKHCEQSHQDCNKRNLQLAQAILDMSRGSNASATTAALDILKSA